MSSSSAETFLLDEIGSLPSTTPKAETRCDVARDHQQKQMPGFGLNSLGLGWVAGASQRSAAQSPLAGVVEGPARRSVTGLDCSAEGSV